MDTQTSSKPSWWVLLIFVGLVLGLLVLAHRLMPSLGWREVADISILILGYGLVELWLRQSSAPLIEDHPDSAKNHGDYMDSLPAPEDHFSRQIPQTPLPR